jgi:hypothetical protein
LAHKTPSYDTNVLPKVVFNIKVFVKFKISINSKENMDETDSKQPKIHRKIKPMDFKNLKKKIRLAKVSRLLVREKSAYGFLKFKKKNPRTKSLETFTKSL